MQKKSTDTRFEVKVIGWQATGYFLLNYKTKKITEVLNYRNVDLMEGNLLNYTKLYGIVVVDRQPTILDLLPLMTSLS